jgi:hypothetical protein
MVMGIGDGPAMAGGDPCAGARWGARVSKFLT